jgi:hypothetical protein
MYRCSNILPGTHFPNEDGRDGHEKFGRGRRLHLRDPANHEQGQEREDVAHVLAHLLNVDKINKLSIVTISTLVRMQVCMFAHLLNMDKIKKLSIVAISTLVQIPSVVAHLLNIAKIKKLQIVTKHW